LKAQQGKFDRGISFLEKLQDGKEEERKSKTLKKIMGYEGGNMFQGKCDQGTRDAVNHRKRISQNGGDPCYDVLDELGSSIYAYLLPLNLMRGLMQGFNTETSVAQFIHEARTLASHKGTNYMFLHWLGKTDESASGDYRQHKFIKERPDLKMTIESLDNYLCRKIVCNPSLAFNKQPGILSNMKLIPEPLFQTSHWDFGKWCSDIRTSGIPSRWARRSKVSWQRLFELVG
jgi:hypothetical protein